MSEPLSSSITIVAAYGYQPPEEFEQALIPVDNTAGATMSFFRHEENYRSDGLTKLTGRDLPIAPRTIGVDESPTGYSLASCSPAELASASPAAHNCTNDV